MFNERSLRILLGATLAAVILVVFAFSNFFVQSSLAPKWMIIYFLSLFLGLSSLFLGKKEPNPSLSKKIWVTLFLGSIWLSYLVITHGTLGFEKEILDILVFFFLSFQVAKFYPSFIRSQMLLKVSLCLVLSLYIIWLLSFQTFELLGLGSLFEYLIENSFLNLNIFAEVLALLSLVTACSLLARRVIHFEKFIFILLSFSLLVLTQIESRAAWIGLVIASGIIVKFSFFKERRLIFAYGLIILIGLSQFTSFSAKTSGLMAAKESSIQTRLLRWQNSLDMAKDFPFGIGPGKFAWAYLDYYQSSVNDFEIKPGVISVSPHNILLEILVEWGWPGLLIISFLMFLFLSELYGTMKIEMHQGLTALSVLIFCLIDGLFAFPLETPIPFLFFCIFALAAVWKKAEGLKPPRFLMPTAFIVILILTFQFIFAHVSLSYSKQNISLAKWSCRFSPSVWQNCYNYTKKLIQSENLDEADRQVQRMLEIQPQNYFARNLLLEIISAKERK